MLNPQCEEKIQVTRTPFLYDEAELSDLKLQEALFFVSNFNYFIFGFTLNQPFQTCLCFLLKLTLKRKNTNSVLELISVVIWKPIPVDNPRATINFVDYSRLRTEIRVHQLIEHQSTGHTPTGHESVIEVFLNSDLLSIEDQGLLFS